MKCMTFTEVKQMWNMIGTYLKLCTLDNTFYYSIYSYSCGIPESSKYAIYRKSDKIICENEDWFVDQVVEVKLLEKLDQSLNPQKVPGVSSLVNHPTRSVNLPNTFSFKPTDAHYMTIKVRSDSTQNGQIEYHTYYFVRNDRGVYMNTEGFNRFDRMKLIVSVETEILSEEEIDQIIAENTNDGVYHTVSVSKDDIIDDKHLRQLFNNVNDI